MNKIKSMEKTFFNTLLEEQETVINIDYSKSELSIYTNRKSIYLRILHKLGEPNEKFYIENKLCGARWIINFKDKKLITSILSRPLLIANIK